MPRLQVTLLIDALAQKECSTSVAHVHVHVPWTASANLLDGQDVNCRVERPKGRANGLGVNLVIVIIVVVLEDVCHSKSASMQG